MARKNQNTFEKRRRDMEKKLRADEKRKKRQKKNAGTESTPGDSALLKNESLPDSTNPPPGV